jgi:hypothetical protein
MDKVEFTQDNGPHVFPALAKILERLAGGLPVGTRRDRAPGLAR